MSSEQESPDMLWFREDRVRECLAIALNYAVEGNGQESKAVAWDVNHRFWQALRPYGDHLLSVSEFIPERDLDDVIKEARE